MKSKKLLLRLAEGRIHNVAFNEMANLAQAFGFQLKRVSGSHHIFAHPAIPELLNLQQVKGEAKPYQIRQFLRVVEKYSLRLEEGE